MPLGLAPDAWRLLASGLLVTVGVAVCAAVLALLTAFVVGLAQLSRRTTLRVGATVYIEFWRGASALVQLFIAFYVLPLFGIDFPPFVVAVVVLGLNVGAYGSQIVRAAVQSVAPGQREASLALGLTRAQTLRLVVAPQALPAMLAPFANEAVELLKLTAATSLITLRDLSLAARMLVQRDGHTTLVYAVELGLYFLAALPLLLLTRTAERRLRSRGRAAPALTPVNPL